MNRSRCVMCRMYRVCDIYIYFRQGAADASMLAFDFACGQCIMTRQYNSSTWKGLSEYRNSRRDCQNVAVVCAAGLRQYIYPRNIIYNDFLRSATISLFCFVERVGLVSIHLLTHHIG